MELIDNMEQQIKKKTPMFLIIQLMHITGRTKTSLVNISESVFGDSLKKVNVGIYYEFQVGI